MAPALEKAKADKAQADAVAAQAAAKAQAARAAKLRAKADMEEDGEDGNCASKGMPPRGIKIRGGTYDDNYVVAQSLNCVHEHPESLSYSQAMANYYCCP